MNQRVLIASGSLLVVLFLLLPAGVRAQAFLDDFADGNISDGDPVSWGPFVAPWDEGTVEAVDGDLLLTPSPTIPSFPEDPDYINVMAVVEDRIYQDVSVHTQARISGQGQGGHGFGVAVRETITLGADYPGANVWAGVFVDVDLNRYITFGGFTGTGPVATRLAPTVLDFHETDIHLQLDVIGDMANVFAWQDGQEKPTRPVLSSRLVAGQMGAGSVYVWQNQRRPPLNDLHTATFRFVEVVPEPSTALLAGLGLLGLLIGRRSGQ